MADMEKINELIANKEFNEAKGFIEDALVETPDNIELLKLAGLVEVNLENWNDGKINFETVVKFSPEDATSWFYLGNCYEKLGDFVSSKNAYLTVIKLRPEYVEVYKCLCLVLLKLGDIDETIKYAQIGGELEAEVHLYDFIIGTSYMKKKEFELAKNSFEKAIEKMSSDIMTLNSLGTCNIALGHFEDAIKIYKRTIELSPKNPMTYYNLGSVYQIQQNHKEAIEYFKKALELEEDESFLVALAISEVKLNDYEQALKHYKQLALMCPTKENYKYNIVTCYEALGDYQTAINMLEKQVYINPKFILPAQKLANLYIKTNQLIKAKEIYDNILLKDKVTAEVMHEYAVLSSNLCDTDTAEKMLKKVIKMNPEIAKAHKDLGIIYLNKRLFDYAEDEFLTALKLAPNDFDIIFEYANYLYSVSKNTEAETYYNEALELQPKSVIALTFMALNKLVLNQLEEAHKYITEALKYESEHEYVLFCAGRIFYAMENFEDAKMYLIRAVEKNPNIETQNTLALTYFKLGEYNQALNIFKNIDEKSPQNISVLKSIAQCYEALNENDNALEYLDKIVEIFPDDEDTHEMIRKLS